MRSELQWSTVSKIDAADESAIERILDEHLLPAAGSFEKVPLGIYARDDSGKIVGGLTGYTLWTWLHVRLLAVSPEGRGKGLGTDLLTRAEAEARKRGCKNAFLDTFSFQARPFYEKMGYSVFGELPDFPPGHSRYYLRKELD